jgi:GT2 family glycosyltransferase
MIVRLYTAFHESIRPFMKLSIVVICWNDLNVIKQCLASVFSQTKDLAFEVIVTDNGSTDGSVDYIRWQFPQVRIVENRANLGFARGNNAGIAAASGQYVLILNPDTLIQDRALEKLVAYADQHPEGGAFGCRVLNADGSYQDPARPLPTLRGMVVAAFCQRWLGYLSEWFLADKYVGWQGESERAIGFQSGCCVMLRGSLLKELGGFDERFFYHYEETDLCKRVWEAGSKVLFCPTAAIVHLGWQSRGRLPIRFALEICRNRYRYFYKHFGARGAVGLRRIWILHVGVRWLGYHMKALISRDEYLVHQLKMFGVVLWWNWRLDPLRFLERGQEPDAGYEPLAPAPETLRPAARV